MLNETNPCHNIAVLGRAILFSVGDMMGVNPDILRLMPKAAKNILEIGGGAGELAIEYSKTNKHARWFIIDSDRAAISEAHNSVDIAICREIHNQSDIMNATARITNSDTVDCVVLGDVLEHMIDPWGVLTYLRGWIKKDGYVIASIPNARHFSFLQTIIERGFIYEQQGLFDKTHLRFFTLNTMVEMFERAGLVVESIDGRCTHLADGDFIRGVTRLFPNVAPNDAPEYAALQYVLVGKKP